MEVETFYFLAYLRKRDPAIALAAECAIINCKTDDENDEWSRLAIMQDPMTENVILVTSFGIMQRHCQAHAPLRPQALNVKRIFHENIPNKIDVVKIIGTGECFDLSKPLVQKRTTTLKPDDDFGIGKAFANLKLHPPKPEVKHEVKHEVDYDGSGDEVVDRSGSGSDKDGFSSSSSSSDDWDAIAPDPAPPAPDPDDCEPALDPAPPAPAPIPRLLIPTPGHVLRIAGGFIKARLTTGSFFYDKFLQI
jgi:hypothetical protein